MRGKREVRTVLGIVLLALLPLVALTGCEREQRRFRAMPASATPATSEPGGPERLGELRPGPHPRPVLADGPYDENAYGISQGKQLYQGFNCVGCHSHGGGGMGPALMDDQWIYGSEPQNIFSSIVEGRPNGMPSYRGRIPEDQVWQLVGYVRSLGGLTPKSPSTARSDHLFSGPSEQARERERSPKPARAEHPG